MSDDSATPAPSLSSPRYWPSRLGLALVRGVARLPLPWLRRLGTLMGGIAALLLVVRKRVAARNLALCFPELDEAQRRRLLAANLRDSGHMLVEFALAWFGSDKAIARIPCRMDGLEHLQRAREQGFYADAALNLARAEQAQRSTRERLTRLLGLWGAQAQFTLPERLPDLPKSTVDLPDIERLALEQRLDVRGAKLAAEQTAKNLGLTRTTRFINVLEVGAIYNTFNDAPSQRGYEIGFELPLFDWGDARVAKAEAIYMQALDRAAQTAIDARSEVREAYTGYRSAYDIARHHRDQIVPVRQRIAEENLLRYNGMLIGVFELLADARAQIASVNNYIESLRDFWIAQADLDMALIGKPSLTAPAGPAAAAESGGPGH